MDITLIKFLFVIIPTTLLILFPIVIVLAIVFYVLWRKKKQVIYKKWYRFYRNLALIFLVLNLFYSIIGGTLGCPKGTYSGLISISSYQDRPAVDNTDNRIVDVNFIFEPKDPGSFVVSHEGYDLHDFPAVYYSWIQNMYTYLKYSKLMSYLFNPPRKVSYEVTFTFSKYDFERYREQKQFDSKDTKQTTVNEILRGGCLPYIGIDAFEFSADKNGGQVIKRSMKLQ